MQTAPRRLQLLEIFVMQDQVDLCRELLVDCADDGFDALVGVVAHREAGRQRLLGQRLHREIDRLASLIGLRGKLAIDQRREVGLVSAGGGRLLLGLCGSHG